MSYWDSENGEIVRMDAKPHPRYDGWLIVDCGCCGGVEWGAVPPPNECSRCGGGGVLSCHIESGALAQYPGGPMVGAPARDSKVEIWVEEAARRLRSDAPESGEGEDE